MIVWNKVSISIFIFIFKMLMFIVQKKRRLISIPSSNQHMILIIDFAPLDNEVFIPLGKKHEISKVEI